MSKESGNSGGGINIFGALGLLLVTFKLLGITSVAQWSWWEVTAPFWAPLALVAFIFLCVWVSGLFQGR